MTPLESHGTAPTFPSRRQASAALALGMLGFAGSARAQDVFPSRPVRIVIPTAPGGNLDLLARTIAEKMSTAWGQQVIVESRAGANTMLATSAVAKSPADGYTALFTISGFVQNLVLQANPPYKASDLAPVSMVASFPIAMAANASLPANTLAEVIALAKAKPRSLSFGSYGVGSAAHVIGAGLNKAAGIDIVHVPYKGEAASYPDLVSGQVQLAYGSVGFYARQLSEGRVKLIVMASPRRLKDFPNVPTFAEAGFPEINLPGWGGLFLPAGTPSPIIDKWGSEVRRICALPDVLKKIQDMGFETVANTPTEFGGVIASDLERWTAVVKSSGIKLD